MGKSCYVGNSEPAIGEILADPIVHLVMSRDGLQVYDVRAVITRARNGLYPSPLPKENSAIVECTI
jgi:hypothetical protein